MTVRVECTADPAEAFERCVELFAAEVGEPTRLIVDAVHDRTAAGELWIWNDDTPRALAGATSTLGGVRRIGPVERVNAVHPGTIAADVWRWGPWSVRRAMKRFTTRSSRATSSPTCTSPWGEAGVDELSGTRVRRSRPSSATGRCTRSTPWGRPGSHWR